MKEFLYLILKKSVLIVVPTGFWLLLTALGFGSQSLANLIEVMGLFILSTLCTLIPERLISQRYLLSALLFIAFLLRLLTPILPE